MLFRSDTFGNPRKCKVAAVRAGDNEFQDISAPNGSFFYVINPCVSEANSTSGVDECSHRLVMTPNVLEYSGSLSQHFIAKTEELLRAEAAYNALMNKLNGLTRRITLAKEQCLADFRKATEDYKNDRSAAQTAKGMDTLAAIGIAAGIGVLAGGIAQIGRAHV